MIKWCFEMSFSNRKMHFLFCRGEYRGQGVRMEISTPVDEHGQFGKAKMAFFCDGDEREFHSEDELMAAIDEKMAGRHERERIIAKIMLPVDAGMLKALDECFPSGIVVEPHGDEIWVMKREVTE